MGAVGDVADEEAGVVLEFVVGEAGLAETVVAGVAVGDVAGGRADAVDEGEVLGAGVAERGHA